MIMRCIILDDEPLAIDVLKDYTSNTPFLELEETFRDPVNALAYLEKHQCNLIFLDITMPGLTGIQFLQSLKNHPFVIFTTAYPQYAVESYEYEAVDYLLKPIEYSRFLRAVTKAYKLYLQSAGEREQQSEEPKTILLKSGTGYHRIPAEEILFLKSTGNYITFVTGQKKILCLMSMKQAGAMLPAAAFMRVHKSFMINVRRVEVIDKEKIKIGDYVIPIGEHYRNAFFDTIKKM